MGAADRVALVYFVYVASASWLRPVSRRRRAQITAIVAAAVLIILASRAAAQVVRDWLPLLYATVAYYLTGLLFVAPSRPLEAWLMAWDRRLLGDPTTRFARWPAAIVGYLNVVYTFCFALLPAGYAALAATGRSALADHYWTMVLAADLAAFAPLSVFQTRPPWALERAATLRAPAAHRMATYLVRHLTIGANTFPSGHVAVSLAVAFALMGAMPIAAAVMLVLAISIAFACVVGRYHYVMDVVTGTMLALAVWAIVAALGI